MKDSSIIYEDSYILRGWLKAFATAAFCHVTRKGGLQLDHNGILFKRGYIFHKCQCPEH